ncbi:MAG: hypothetical protein JW786_12015 [Desulfobacterales bacterium]|nr:hypothetical protein [Desulfobacterales bacterium]
MNESEIKFLVDVGVGHLVEQYLSSNDYDIRSVRDLDPRMPDEEIIQIALTKNASLSQWIETRPKVPSG